MNCFFRTVRFLRPAPFFRFAACVVAWFVCGGIASANEAAADFSKHVAGFLQKHCVHCHGEKEPKADLALHVFRDEAAVVKEREQWQTVVDMVELGEMPPQGRPRPAAEEVAEFLKAVDAVFERADRNAKPDPGSLQP